MRRKGFKLITLITVICMIFTMAGAGAFAEESKADVYDRLEDALAQAKGETGNGGTAAETPETAEPVKLVVPTSSVKGLPDRFSNFDNPLNGETTRMCEVSAAMLYRLAERASLGDAAEFYIDASQAGKNIKDTRIEIETGMYPASSSGRYADFGILTNQGYLHIGAQAAFTLLNETLYDSLKIEIVKYEDTQYRVVFRAEKLDGSTEEIFTLPEGSVTFTVWPAENFIGKTIKSYGSWFSQEGFSGECIWNEDGTLTFMAPGTGTYNLRVYEKPVTAPIPNHTLEIVNQELGYVDMDQKNNYITGAEAGAYLQDVFINGVSMGALSKIVISEGDEIVVIYAKIGEKVDTTKYDAAAAAEAARLEKLKKGVQNTTIKASTVSGVKKGVKITWKKSKGYSVDAYEIWRSTKKSSGYKKTYTTASGSKTSYTNTKTTKGTRYYYKVRGVRTIGGEKVYTNWSNRCYRIAK